MHSLGVNKGVTLAKVQLQSQAFVPFFFLRVCFIAQIKFRI